LLLVVVGVVAVCATIVIIVVKSAEADRPSVVAALAPAIERLARLVTFGAEEGEGRDQAARGRRRATGAVWSPERTLPAPATASCPQPPRAGPQGYSPKRSRPFRFMFSSTVVPGLW
jgi:hypothetical protein